MGKTIILLIALALCCAMAAGAFAVPVNDDCSSATAIGEVTNLAFSTVDGTYDNTGSCIASGPNIWYVYTPTFTGTAIISLCGSSYNTKLAVYNGNSCSPLGTLLACNDNYPGCGTASQAFVYVSGPGGHGEPANNYLIEIGGASNSSGTGVLTISQATSAPLNDNCSSALAIGEVTNLTFTTEQGTYDGSGTCITSGSNIWYDYVPTFTGDAIISLCGSHYNTVLTVYDGNTCSPLPTQLGCNDDYIGCTPQSSQLTIPVIAPVDHGETHHYFIEIGGHNGATGVGVLTIGRAAVAGDDCAHAIGVVGESTWNFSTIGATADGAGSCISGPNIWYDYVPSFTGNAIISLCGSSYNTVLAVYDGNICSPLPTQLGCNDDYAGCSPQSQLTVPVIAPVDHGETHHYLIEIGGFQGATGAGVLTISAPPLPPVNDDCPNATNGGTLVAATTKVFNGTTANATMDCSQNPNPEVWAKFTVRACMTVAIQFTNVPTFNSPYAWLFDACPCGNIINADSTTYDRDGNATIWKTLQAGTYWYPIGSQTGYSGSYRIEVTGEWCAGHPPADAAITAPDTITGNTCGALNDCTANAGADYIYQVTIPSDAEWTFSLCNTPASWNSYMSLGTQACLSDITSNDDGCGTINGLSKIVQTLTTGTYYLTIDSPEADHNPPECGAYTLEITGRHLGCQYTPGDANNSGIWTGQDVTYSVRFFKGGNPPPYSCECTTGHTWYVAGDVNGSCTFTGQDVTFMVRHFKSGVPPIVCPDCPPTSAILRNPNPKPSTTEQQGRIQK
jgi:hypothetical protein